MSDIDGGLAPPSWPTPRRRRWWHQIDIKIVIAVLIGLVSVTGAFLTWQANQQDENATDQDRLAVAQTVQLRQTEAQVDATLRDEQASFEQFRLLRIDAAQKLAQATDLRNEAKGADAATAAQLQTLATSAETQAGQDGAQADALSSSAFLISLVSNDDQGLPQTYDTDARKESLFISLKQTPDLDPQASAQQGVHLRSRGQRLSGWAIPLVIAVVLLTFAQLSRKKGARNTLVALAMVVYLVSTVIAFVGE